ncbi:hypothetical protein EBT31_17815 [bacterium]|nr:hypothetical protein [bacterium]
MPATDRQLDQVPHAKRRRVGSQRTKNSTKKSKRPSLKDARTSRELLEMNDWNPFVRVDGAILEQLHKRQLLATVGEATW